MHSHGFDNVTPDQEKPAQGPTKWRRRGADRRLPEEGANVISDMEKRTTGDRRTRWLEFISKIIFPRGSKTS